jgi:photosystem II stability/assembly factor-like uncharacterized protein
MSHIVQVVSMLLVMMSFGVTVFQSRDVKGAVCSGVFELDNNAKGVSFWAAGSRVFTVEDREIVFEEIDGGELGKDHSRKWSPEVANRSVDCLEAIGGSQRIRVTG